MVRASAVNAERRWFKSIPVRKAMGLAPFVAISPASDFFVAGARLRNIAFSTGFSRYCVEGGLIWTDSSNG